MDDRSLDFILAQAQIENGVSADVLIKNGVDPKIIAIASRTDVKTKARKPTWTDEDDQVLRDNIGVIRFDQIGELIGRSANAVKIRMTRLEITAPSKQGHYITMNRVADALSNDFHNIEALYTRGILRFETAPTMNKLIRWISRLDLYHWCNNPMNWPYFLYSVSNEIRYINDGFISKLIARKMIRWNDEWWSTGQAARHFGLTSSGPINKRIRNGVLPAVRWGNWHVKKSDALKLKIRSRGSYGPKKRNT